VSASAFQLTKRTRRPRRSQVQSRSFQIRRIVLRRLVPKPGERTGEQTSPASHEAQHSCGWRPVLL